MRENFFTGRFRVKITKCLSEGEQPDQRIARLPQNLTYLNATVG